MKKSTIVAIALGVILLAAIGFAAYSYFSAKPQDEAAEAATPAEAVAVQPGQVDKQYLVWGPGLKFDQFIPATPAQHATWRSKLDSAKAGKSVDLKFLGLPAGTKIDSFRVADQKPEQKKDQPPQESTWLKIWRVARWIILGLVIILLAWWGIKKIMASSGGGSSFADIMGKKSKVAHYIWWAIALLLLLVGLYCAPTAPLAAVPLILLSCVCFSVGKNHHDAQPSLTDTVALDGFWAFRHNWSQYRIWWFYLALGLGWLAFTLGKLSFLWRTIR